MTGKHWAALAAFIGGLSAVVGSLPSWGEATQPLFISGVLAQASAAILLLYADKPGGQ